MTKTTTLSLIAIAIYFVSLAPHCLSDIQIFVAFVVCVLVSRFTVNSVEHNMGYELVCQFWKSTSLMILLLQIQTQVNPTHEASTLIELLGSIKYPCLCALMSWAAVMFGAQFFSRNISATVETRMRAYSLIAEMVTMLIISISLSHLTLHLE
jgi:hypothetical protein